MSSKSSYLSTTLLNFLFRDGAFTAPSTLYIGLHANDPLDDGTGGEVSGGSYARVGVANDAGNWSAPVSDGAGAIQITNAVTITFPTPSADWGTVAWASIWDAPTGGNLLFRGVLTTPRVIVNGDVAPHFATGVLVLKEQ